MPRIENVLDNYSPLLDYEWEVKIDDEREYVCQPTFRYAGDPEYDSEIECWPATMDRETARLYNAILYFKYEQFLSWLPPIIPRIIVTRDGDEIRRYYHVKNIFSREAIEA